MKMSIESKDVLGAGTLTPTFTERTITGTARVQNNRTMMLASVAQDISAQGKQGLPILGLIPVLGRLFTSPTRDNRRIDIVIAVTPRVLRAPAVTPRDEEMRPSGTLQSPTTGSLEAMLREADREDQLAEWRSQQKNTTAKAAPVPNSTSPGVFVDNARTATDGSGAKHSSGSRLHHHRRNRSDEPCDHASGGDSTRSRQPRPKLPRRKRQARNCRRLCPRPSRWSAALPRLKWPRSIPVSAATPARRSPV